MASQKHGLDLLAQNFHKSHRQSARKHYPQTDFSNGVTNLSNMTASEECGLVFYWFVYPNLMTVKLLDDALVTKGQKTNLSKVLEALEALACFDAWTQLDKFWKISQETKYARQAK